MTLLEECLEALGAAAQPVSDPALCSRILDSLLLTDTGRIDWNAYTQVQACAPAELPPGSWYIVWSDPEKPILRCGRQGILSCLEDVLAVAFDTWMVSEQLDRVVEFYHEGAVTMGVRKGTKNGSV